MSRWRGAWPARCHCVAAAVAAGIVAGGVLAAAAPRTLDIYWIDVEGGASTLVVTPQGESILMDAGWAGFGDRDAARIAQVAKEAGLERIDYVLVSHFHLDHLGGLAALAERVPITSFVDHGDLDQDTAELRELWNRYRALAAGRRHTAHPGDRLPLQAVQLTIVAAGRQVISAALRPDAVANPLCAAFEPHEDDATENASSLGYVLQDGDFDFVNLGDLSWNGQARLACPVNLLGNVDVFQVTHHGVRDDVLPQQMWAMSPTVAVMNNGPTKGAGSAAVETVLRSPGLEDLWSLHRAGANDAAHNAPERLTANLGGTDGCPGAWIRLRVNPNGSFAVMNSRNGYSKTYGVK